MRGLEGMKRCDRRKRRWCYCCASSSDTERMLNSPLCPLCTVQPLVSVAAAVNFLQNSLARGMSRAGCMSRRSVHAATVALLARVQSWSGQYAGRADHAVGLVHIFWLVRSIPPPVQAWWTSTKSRTKMQQFVTVNRFLLCWLGPR